MYEMPRKLWIATYVAVWVIVVTIFATGQPMWVCVIASALSLAFVGFTDPAPRSFELVRAGCDCARCDRMRGRHKRRSTDVKDAD
ncbi:hypothetical protein SEA_YDN12_60 [Streptomyces phage YDN12]|uniref:Uncharacterized protein n=1 Tax=Streptomyces phage YDN12 TaxID=1636183 RepID=A0A0E3JQF7_9CAUD|nr:hypothetical protein AVT63_gp59 [Streptomyces phage YDN12]AKA61727.1 hypothetical protein SEA_YDN12_60 [Streptomyces phage YDN12]